MSNKFIYGDYECMKWVHQCRQRYDNKIIKRIVVMRNSNTGETIVAMSDDSANRIRRISRLNNQNYNQVFSGDVKNPIDVRHKIYECLRDYKSVSGNKHCYILTNEQYEELVNELDMICVFPVKYGVVQCEDGIYRVKESVCFNRVWAD